MISNNSSGTLTSAELGVASELVVETAQIDWATQFPQFRLLVHLGITPSLALLGQSMCTPVLFNVAMHACAFGDRI